MIISVKWNNKNSTFKIGEYTFNNYFLVATKVEKYTLFLFLKFRFMYLKNYQTNSKKKKKHRKDKKVRKWQET